LMSSASADKSSIRRLYGLQQVDTGLRQAADSLLQTEASLKDERRLVAARAALDVAVKTETEIGEALHQLEWEADDFSAKIKTIGDKLYSGKVGNPKELSNLQQESDQFQARRKAVEDAGMETMERLEKATAAAQTARDTLAKVEQARKEQRQLLSTKAVQLKDEINSLKAERQELVTVLDPAVVKLYERLRGQSGVAVATVEQGVCSGCRISLFAAQLRQARAGELTQCGNCGRILYIA
jgi:uncharacterized protein